MKGLKEQENKLKWQLAAKVTIVVVAWLILAIVLINSFIQVSLKTQKIPTLSTVPEVNVDKATSLQQTLDQIFQFQPPPTTTGTLEPFD